MKLGIVGLPNVGKSTLFNAITSTKNAEAANYPFCTIEPNSGIVAVPDKRAEVKGKTVVLADPEDKSQVGSSIPGMVSKVNVKPGDQVIIGKYSGTEIKCDGEEYTVVRQGDILCIVTK